MILLVAGSMALLIAWTLMNFAGWPWLAALLAGVCAPFLSHGMILGTEFVMSNLIGRRQVWPTAVTLTDRGGLLKAWLKEMPTAWYLFAYAIPFLGERPLVSARAGNHANKTPVLLVHGYMGNQAVWRPLARWLSKRGHAIAGVNLEPWPGPIEPFAAQLDQAVQNLRRRTGARQVALIGHSMGGLAIRAYLRNYGLAQTRAVVTLGSPHRGTWLGHVAGSPVGRQLSANSDWLCQLAASEDEAVGKLFTIVISQHDNIVTPQASQTIPGARMVAFTGYGHMEYMVRQDVWQVIAAAISESPAGDPNRPDGAMPPTQHENAPHGRCPRQAEHRHRG